MSPLAAAPPIFGADIDTHPKGLTGELGMALSGKAKKKKKKKVKKALLENTDNLEGEQQILENHLVRLQDEETKIDT